MRQTLHVAGSTSQAIQKLAHWFAGSVSVNSEKRSQSLRPGDKQRSIDFQQPMLKMTRSTPPLAPARAHMDLNGARPLRSQYRTSAERHARLACFAKPFSAGSGTRLSCSRQIKAASCVRDTCMEQGVPRHSESLIAHQHGMRLSLSKSCMRGESKAACSMHLSGAEA